MPDLNENLNATDRTVLTQAFLAIANEMGAKLIRSAHSTIVREAEDASTALLDAEGNALAQAELIPMQLGSISHTFQPCADQSPIADLVEGDFYITNDPYHGGQHVPDVFVFSPIFFNDELIGFAASVAHHIDMGGGAPGLNPDATDVHQEGIIFPPSKYNIDRDWHGGPLERLLRANIRMPDHTVGDFNAQFAANAIGAERVRELCRKHGAAKVKLAMVEMQDYSERRMRAAISAAPDGVYHGEDAIDDDGEDSRPLVIKATLTIKGSELSVDFAGSCDQAKTNLNNPFASTVGATASCIKSALTAADIPYNNGCARVVEITAPYGSILNPRPPAPVRARLLPSYRVYNAVMKALAQAVPDRVIATGYDTTTATCLSHLGADGYGIYLEISGGGYGAGPGNDGCDGVDSPLSNCRNIPIEALDMAFPFFRVADYSLVPGSGGQGRYRGGLALQKTYEILADDVIFATYADRFKNAPQGLFGGGPGRVAESYVIRGNEQIPLRSKQSFRLRTGDKLVMRTGGGGGYGPAAERAPAAGQRDLEDGLVTG